jgi:hypothetical protein
MALHSETIDEEDNVRKGIDNVILVTSKQVNYLASEYLNKKFRNRQLTILDGQAISELIAKYQLRIGDLTECDLLNQHRFHCNKTLSHLNGLRWHLKQFEIKPLQNL